MAACLTLLGLPRVHTPRGTIALPDALPGYLIACLGERADWVLREELCALLWPDATVEEAQRNLRVNLNRLRAQLRQWELEDRLEAERRRVRLTLDTDVAALRDACARHDWAAAVEHDGRFLEGMSFRAFGGCGDWARRQGAQLRSQWCAALMQAAAAASPLQALALTDRLARDERLVEPVQRLRLAALVATGRGADALREHARFIDELRAELDAAPSAAFESFARKLLDPLRGAEGDGARSRAPSGPGDADALIGRADELGRARQLLGSQRLLTLVGLGGVGKTRLARALVADEADAFEAGIHWLSLAELNQPSEVLGLLADAAGAAPAADRAGVAPVIERLGPSRRLLVFDNAEHLLDEQRTLARLVDALVAACPGLHVVVTSREPLGLPGEAVIRLQGLAVPAADAAPTPTAAEQFFASHARRVAPAFDPGAEPAALARICRLTGGLPLALRIAAGWTRWLSCAQVADELQRGLDALDPAGAQAHGLLGVRATMDKSWQRLAPPAARALARLAVFAGPFDPAAARTVAEVGLPMLAEFGEVSMLDTVPGPQGRRFQLHPLVRQSALERLAAERGALERAHAAHRRWLEQALAPLVDWRRIDQRAALERVGSLLDELRAAWRSAVEFGDAAFLAATAPVLSRYFEQKGVWNEGLSWFEPAQAQLDPSLPGELAALAALARSQAVLLYRKTDLDAAEAVGSRALAWARELGHAEGVKSTLNTMGLTLLMQSRVAEARAHFEEAAMIAEGDGDTAGEAVFRANIGLADKRTGDFARARVAWQRSLALHREVGNWRSVVNVLSNLGNLLRIEGQLAQAQPLIEEGLRLCDEHGFVSTRPFLLINLARLHADAGRDPTAAQFAEAALTDLQRSGEAMLDAATRLVLAQLALRAREPRRAAPLLAQALRSTAATGDLANRLEALDGYGHWLVAVGRTDHAAAVWRLLLAHPGLHAELRPMLQRQLDTLGARARPDPPGAALDFTAACDQALRELEGAVAHGACA